MKFEAPIPEGKIPTRSAIPPMKYMELYQAVMKLPAGSLLPVVFEDAKEASRLAASLQHSKYAAFKVVQRENRIFVRLKNEDDEKQAAHQKHLRELNRAKKTTAVKAS